MKTTATTTKAASAALALLLLTSVSLTAPELRAQEGVPEGERVVMVHEEPRHRLVVDGGDYKVLDIQIQPGDTTLYHTHNSPILYTFLNLGDGPTGGRVSSNTDYLQEPLTHEVTNDGDELFHIVAIAHYGPAMPESASDGPRGIDAEPQLENPWFRSFRFDLEPGEETGVHRHENPVVIVQVTDGEAEVLRDDGFGSQLHGLGEWAFREAGGTYRLHNAGDTPVSVVVNEARERR